MDRGLGESEQRRLMSEFERDLHESQAIGKFCNKNSLSLYIGHIRSDHKDHRPFDMNKRPLHLMLAVVEGSAPDITVVIKICKASGNEPFRDTERARSLHGPFPTFTQIKVTKINNAVLNPFWDAFTYHHELEQFVIAIVLGNFGAVENEFYRRNGSSRNIPGTDSSSVAPGGSNFAIPSGRDTHPAPMLALPSPGIEGETVDSEDGEDSDYRDDSDDSDDGDDGDDGEDGEDSTTDTDMGENL
jgi:hypothetical protein